MRLFGGSDARSAAAAKAARVPRVSSGWTALLKNLQENEGQRVLDFGPTSPTNINFLTGMSHSIYMADIASEAADQKWSKREPDQPFPVSDFLEENLQFGGREFDCVLFWDTGDYLVPELRQAVVARLHQVLVPGGQLLAFFHIKPDTGMHRYHLRTDGQVDVQWTGDRNVDEVLNSRQIEKLFADFRSYKFFLAKDNLREVLVTR